MTVTIRKLEKTEHEYFAYCKSLCGKATYLLYFDDSIFGAVGHTDDGSEDEEGEDNAESFLLAVYQRVEP